MKWNMLGQNRKYCSDGTLIKRKWMTPFFAAVIAVFLLSACGGPANPAQSEAPLPVEEPLAAEEATGLDADSVDEDSSDTDEEMSAGGNPAAPENAISAYVRRVVDGDTLVVEIDGAEQRVRLIGVDTPESVHPDENRNVPYGEIASAYTKLRLEGADVLLETDVDEYDRYDRLLAYVWLGDELYNETLIRQGHAQVSTYVPNVKYVDLFTEAQTVAQASGLGIWAAGLFEDLTETDAEAVTGSSPDSSANTADASYICNKNSMIFHFSSCTYGQKTAEHNRMYLDSRDEAVRQGFVPCKVCNP